MYCMSRPSLHRESTDSLILQECLSMCLFVCLSVSPGNLSPCLSSMLFRIGVDTARPRLGFGQVLFSFVLPYCLAEMRALLHLRARNVWPSFIDHAPYGYSAHAHFDATHWAGFTSTCRSVINYPYGGGQLHDNFGSAYSSLLQKS